MNQQSAVVAQLCNGKGEIANTVLFDQQAEGRITIGYDEANRTPLIDTLRAPATANAR